MYLFYRNVAPNVVLGSVRRAVGSTSTMPNEENPARGEPAWGAILLVLAPARLRWSVMLGLHAIALAIVRFT